MSSIFSGLLGVVGGCHHLFFVTGASNKAVAVDPNATLPLQECGVYQDGHIELNKFIFTSADYQEVE